MKNRYLKEQYITRNPNPDDWKEHSNCSIINAYKRYIKGKVIDLGCNHGACTYFLSKLNVDEIYGLDINASALNIAKRTFIDREVKNVGFIIADLTSILPFRDEVFDCIVSFHTLEHIYQEDASLVVKEMYRICKKDSHTIIYIPYLRGYSDPKHVEFYDEEKLSMLFSNNGFEVLACFKDDRYKEKNLLLGLFKK